jgi:hypothetical protein
VSAQLRNPRCLECARVCIELYRLVQQYRVGLQKQRDDMVGLDCIEDMPGLPLLTRVAVMAAAGWQQVREQQAAAGPRKALPLTGAPGAAATAATPGGGGPGGQQGGAAEERSEGEEEEDNPALDETERIILRQQNYYKRVHRIK